jgi:glycosyltransferase involved in cell wall biosynthesis
VKVSVLVPAYNCAATIRTALESILCQTVAADEILVMNDGSTDETASIVDSFGPRVKLFWQTNGGVGSARSALCKLASGDLIAFLDSDDIWHPSYLEEQCKLYVAYPEAVAFYTGHVDLYEGEDFSWKMEDVTCPRPVDVIPPLEFFRRYNKAPGIFMCMSYCCIPKWVLKELGDEPFKLRMAEDSYFIGLLAPRGPVVYAPVPLVAYRIRNGSLSSRRLELTGSEVRAFELLKQYYGKIPDRRFLAAFGRAFASKRRTHAKILLGVGNAAGAREHLRASLRESMAAESMAKSGALLFMSYLPAWLQPNWPSSNRVVKTVKL